MDLTTAYGARPDTCTELECDGKHYARGLCKRHYRRAHTAGLLEPLTRKDPETEFRRLADSSGGPDACWPWTGPLDAHGYGVLHASGTWKAHRYSLEVHGTALPDDLVVDHACHNVDPTCVGGGSACLHRRCVNPAHLELAERGENVRRSPVDRTQTHCVHGHELSGENLMVTGGRRRCVECNRQRGREFRERRRRARDAQ